jgi:hypothetical protein
MKNYFYLLLFSWITLSLGLGSCKKQFDEPPVSEYPSITPNATIAEVKALHTIGNTADSITDSLVIEGIVVSSDEKGNFYKQLIIQDDSAGIEIRIEMSNLYNDYPVGRKVWVKCQGLYVGDYQGNHQLTINANGDRIPEGLLSNYIVAGPKDQLVQPKVVTIDQIKNTTIYRNMLVELSQVQFATLDTNQTYADAVGQLSLNRTIQDCNGNTIILRTSGYAGFASDRTASGSGIALGIHTNFGSDAQLYIRDVTDLNLINTRCSPSTAGNLISIATLRASTTIPTNSKIRAYVISDRGTSNIVDQNMVVMDASAGITVRFTSTHSFNEGDELEIPLTGGTISDYNGLKQLEGILSSNITVVSTGNAVPPLYTTTVQNLITNAELYESCLIKILNANISGATTYSGTLTLADATGSIDLFTRFGATFAGNTVACGNIEITGIMGQFTTYQVSVRDPAVDIVGGTPCGGGGGSTITSIRSVRALFTGANTTLGTNLKIKGIVISERIANNIDSKNVIIQDSSGGIVVRFSAAHSFNLGDEIEVNISGGTLGEYFGLLQVSGIATTTATFISASNTITPRIATISQILANAETWESTLVKINGVNSMTGGTTYSGSITLNDGTGNLTMFTRFGASPATFSNTNLPTVFPVNVTGILGQYDSTTPTTSDYQILIRTTNDIN